MTMIMIDKVVVEQVLDALESCTYEPTGYHEQIYDSDAVDASITALREALAQPQPVQQEPVAFVKSLDEPSPRCVIDIKYCTWAEHECGDHLKYVPLYTSPQAAQPLSDEHLSKLLCALHSETNAKINLHEWLRASPALAVRIAQAEDEWVKAVKHLVQVQMAAQEYVTTHVITKGST